jgi:rod shape-determining protein MreC
MKLNKNKPKLEFRNLIIVGLIVFTFIIVIFSYVINDNRSLTTIEKGIKDTSLSFQKVLYTPFRYIGNRINNYQKMKHVYLNYKTDESKLSRYDLIVEENNDLKREIEAMKSLLDINTTYTGYDIINASVINRNVGYWFNTLTIDKGSNHGLKNDMAVIVNQGLIGRIIKVSSYTSDVKLVTTKEIDSKISVAIVNQDNQLTYGLLSGYKSDTKYLLVEQIIDDSLIRVGDVVITSGLSHIFPKGIIVGKVELIKADDFGISKTAFLSSNVDFNDIRFVSILKRKNTNHDN